MDRSYEVKTDVLGDLKNKVILITGASSGLGKEFCLTLAQRGCRVIAAARRTELLEALVNDINSQANGPGPQANLSQIDVSSDEPHIDAAVEKAWHLFGRIDVLVNNAGLRGEVKMSLDLESDEWNKVMNTNLRGLWLMSKAVARRMRSAKISGSIINISSTSSLERGLLVGNSAYASSKAAVNQLTKVMAIELGKYDIRTNAIAAGLFKSEITEELFSKPWMAKVAQKLVPVQRWGMTNPDMTCLVVFLASDSSSYITGNIFIVDGGYSIPGVPFWSSL